MIGYYVHHQGHGHRHRAAAVARRLQLPVTGLSSVAPPPGWPGDWIELPRDDDGDTAVDPTASGALHWVPAHHDGLRGRMSATAAWIERARPRLLVVDVSVEVALLARLCGVPVVTWVLPGERTDPAHALVHRVADRLLAAWPDSAAGMVDGPSVGDPRFTAVGAISRYDDLIDVERPPARPGRRVVVLGGTGGGGEDGVLAAARAATPGWTWTVLDGRVETWTADPWPAVLAADVVVTHAGQNALAEVAAARTPAVVLPAARPHREQERTAAVLARGSWPALVVPSAQGLDWAATLERAAALPGGRWSAWNDGRGAQRAAAVITAAAA